MGPEVWGRLQAAPRNVKTEGSRLEDRSSKGSRGPLRASDTASVFPLGVLLELVCFLPRSEKLEKLQEAMVA